MPVTNELALELGEGVACSEDRRNIESDISKNLTPSEEQANSRGHTLRRSYKEYLGLMIPALGMVLLAIALILLARLTSGQGSGYLYKNDPERSQYVEDYSSDGSHPSFLEVQSIPRVVEFYAPWCGHCQHFASHFVELAKSVRSVQLQQINQPEVKFHAISVTNHDNVFRNYRSLVRGFPTVIAIPPGMNITQGIKMEPYHTITNITVLQTLFNYTSVEHTTSKNNTARNISARPSQRQRVKTDLTAKTPVIAEVDSVKHINSFQDAITSLYFNLCKGIFMDDSGRLNVERRGAFQDFIQLLHYTLPKEVEIFVPVHLLLQDLITNLDNIAESEDLLLSYVAKYRKEGTQNWFWSLACSKGATGMGYSCGLWELFHIMSVGLVERRNELLDSTVHLSTKLAGDTLRSWVHHFFGCLECAKHFVNFYDSCSLDACHRLMPYPSLNREFSSHETDLKDEERMWREFPLWLWEAHNSVNERLMREDAAGDGSPDETKRYPEVIWPNKIMCPKCWESSAADLIDKYDRDAVYNHLKATYWTPNLSQTYSGSSFSSISEFRDDRPLILHLLFAIMTINMAWQLIFLRRKKTDASHKKNDDEPRLKQFVLQV